MSTLFLNRVLQPANMVISRYVMQDSSCLCDIVFKIIQNNLHVVLYLGLQFVWILLSTYIGQRLMKGLKVQNITVA